MYLKTVFWFITLCIVIFFGTENIFAIDNSHIDKVSSINLGKISKRELNLAVTKFHTGVKYLKAKHYVKAVEAFESVILMLRGNKLSSKAFNKALEELRFKYSTLFIKTIFTLLEKVDLERNFDKFLI